MCIFIMKIFINVARVWRYCGHRGSGDFPPNGVQGQSLSKVWGPQKPDLQTP